MQVSYKWLKELLPDLTASAEEVGEKMSLSGIECEEITSPADGLSKIIVGEILSSEDIPETHLHITKVNVGADEPLQIVCGAPNVVVGNKAIVALVGARIADNYKIKKGKIRGVESLGMLCALDELGVSEKINPMKHEDGIYVMPADAKVGDDVFTYLDMDDKIIDLDVLANRGDALSMRGVAHEVGAIYDLKPKFPSSSALIASATNVDDSKQTSLQESVANLTEIDKKASEVVKVAVKSDKVPTYKIRVIENVKIAKSPVWLQNRLMNAGIKPINNVVDVTNFVLMYYGQPLHSFDFDQFGSNEIVVRQAENDEKIMTLDHSERELSVDDIVITSNGKPVALGGVMGGLDSEITEKTATVALEAALFDGKSIRKTSQKFNLRSEASSRFEKGINQGTVREALDFAASMIAELAGGQILSGVVESNDYQPEPVSVKITLDLVNGALGTNLVKSDVEKIFAQLGFDSTENAGEFTVKIPSRRWDIHIEADLVEEIARIYGYDNLPSTLPSGSTAGALTQLQKYRRELRTKVEANGLSEVIGYSLMSPEKALEFLPSDFPTTSLMMPMSEERQTLRVNMIPGLLDIINYNQNRKNADVAIYEIGNIFLPSEAEDGRPTERQNLAFAISGNISDKTYAKNPVPVDFYHAKGIVENLLSNHENVTFTATSEIAAMHPGRTAIVQIGDKHIGFVGQIHPALAKKYDIKETFVAGLDIETMLETAPAQTVFNEIPKIPAVSRDIALLVDEKITHAQLVENISAAKVKTLTKIELFDIYAGENVAKGKKSMAYSLTFQANETMTDEQITAALNKITKNLVENLNVEIR